MLCSVEGFRPSVVSEFPEASCYGAHVFLPRMLNDRLERRRCALEGFATPREDVSAGSFCGNLRFTCPVLFERESDSALELSQVLLAP